MPPPRVYMQVSRSGQMRRPCNQMSSPTLTTAVISCSLSPGPTAGRPSAAFTPSRNRAPPTQPTSTVTFTGTSLLKWQDLLDRHDGSVDHEGDATRRRWAAGSHGAVVARGEPRPEPRLAEPRS